MKIIHWKKGHKGLGEPVTNYIIFNAMTMKLYHIEKVRNPDCIQCGKNRRRVVIKMKPNSICMNIIKTLEKNGFQLESDLEPIITLLDFNDILILDLEKSVAENNLRNFEYLTIAGFKGGELSLIHI